MRTSNVFKLFVDGVHVGIDYTQSQNYTNQIRYIGHSTNSEVQTWYMDGKISNFRFIKGTALYTKNFTPPTAPLTNVTNTKLLCCQSNTLRLLLRIAKCPGINNGIQWSSSSNPSEPSFTASGINTVDGSTGYSQYKFIHHICTKLWRYNIFHFSRSNTYQSNGVFTTVSDGNQKYHGQMVSRMEQLLLSGGGSFQYF